MPSAATRSSSMGSSDIEFALDLEDIAARAAKADCIGVLACGRARFSYHRLPEPPLRLTVRKLDDSYFGTKSRPLPFNSPRTMCESPGPPLWELKAAIQGVFVALYHDMENAVTWQHVWSHFCLCFKDEKMTDDKASCVIQHHKQALQEIICRIQYGCPGPAIGYWLESVSVMST
ncbi:hypothetical protein ZWY2020_024507 [Hordeum vulgare]|nr:hypothetical protein ZWY2020_024507 [Hordeum vulgare]